MGIILYEFLVGCVPFFGDTPEELFSQVINGKFSKISVALCTKIIAFQNLSFAVLKSLLTA